MHMHYVMEEKLAGLKGHSDIGITQSYLLSFLSGSAVAFRQLRIYGYDSEGHRCPKSERGKQKLLQHGCCVELEDRQEGLLPEHAAY